MNKKDKIFIVLFSLIVLLTITDILQFTTKYYKEVEQTIVLQDTSYNRVVLDSIQYNIIIKDSIIYNLKEEMKYEVNKVQHMSDTDAIKCFYNLVSDSKPISSLYGEDN